MSPIKNRYEFAYLFDVTNGNPNGDPDAGNMPRIDPETNQGLVTDVCLKRKIRNYVLLDRRDDQGHPKKGFDIYVTEKAILNSKHEKAYESVGGKKIDNKGQTDWDNNKSEDAKMWMCKNYFDIRTFGAVMSTGEAKCGQVRGPVQFAFASSIDPIFPQEMSITRMAVTNKKDIDKKDPEKNRTFGKKHIVPYGLYRVHGYISAKLAEQTGFSEDDLELLWESLKNMFEHDRSAARGEMAARKLFVFKHDNPMGNEHAHKLFSSIEVNKVKKNAPPRRFADYEVKLNTPLKEGVELIELIENSKHF